MNGTCTFQHRNPSISHCNMQSSVDTQFIVVNVNTGVTVESKAD